MLYKIMSKIKSLKAREIIDSRGNPTIEVSCELESSAKAVAAAGGIWSSDPAKPELLPYVARLLSDPVWQVRMWAANSLMLMRDKSVIPDLEPLLNDDRPEVARTAKEAISKLQQKETAPKDH